MTNRRFIVAGLGVALFWGGVFSIVMGERSTCRTAMAASARTEQALERSQALQPGAVCDLEQVSGPIVVRVASGNVAKLRAVVSVRGSGEAARRALSQVRVDITSDARALRARATYDRHARSYDDDDIEVAYTLELPAGAQLRVRTVSGDVDVAAAPAGANLRSVSGEVKLARAGGEVRVETISGDVRLSSIGGRLQLHTVSGDVMGELAAGLTSADVETVSGEVELKAAAGLGLQVNASTMSGEVENEVGAGGKVPLRVHTLSGDIHVKQSP